jgi:sugar lactone lactonase YvrE
VAFYFSSQANLTIERVTEPYGLSEGPHWDHRTQKLYFVDIYNQYIRRLDTATGIVTSAYIGKIECVLFFILFLSMV